MQTGYFSVALQDIKNSPGWFGKLVVLSLIGFIPVFGQIVLYGYFFGWARDIAWNVHAPLPAHILGNEDGKLYSRGFFALIIALVCSLIPQFIALIGNFVTQTGFVGVNYLGYGNTPQLLPFSLFSGLMSVVFFVLVLAIYFFSILFSWVGSMRMSIYGRLSAGFQLGKIWAMMRYDSNGLLRIFCMSLLLDLAVSAISFALLSIPIAVGVAAGGLLGVSAINPSSFDMSPSVAGIGFVLVGVVLILALLCLFVTMIASVFTEAMITRALGYWTRQFEVATWCGQEDPMPFERRAATSSPDQVKPRE